MRSRVRKHDPERRSPTPLSRRFTYRYLLAIGLFVAFGLGAKISNDRALAELDRNTARLEAAASQPARVHRILELADRIDAQPSASDVQVTVGDLEQEVDTLRTIESALAQGTGEAGLPATQPSGELQDLYFGTETRLDQHVKDIVNAGQQVADFAADSPDAAMNRTAQIAVLEKTVAATSDQLERAVGLYAARNSQIVSERQSQSDLLLLGGVVMVGFTVLVLFRPMARSIHMETSQLEKAEQTHRENNERQTFRNDLTSALGVTDDRSEVFAVVERALAEVVPTRQAELLLSDASQSHLRPSAVQPDHGPAGCPVDSPKSCAAIRTTEQKVYETSKALNVCPKLPEHKQAPCSAVCIPVSFNGQAMGVLHLVGPDEQPPSDREVDRVSIIATETGARLSHLQVTEMTQLQATTDGLTGLLNRRSVEARARTFIVDRRPFAIAMADLDDFKELNDTFGHEAGDRALRTFAASLRRHLRPDDVASRFGGEEFVVLFPDTRITEAARALNRLQTAIASDIRRSSTEPFTISWGLVDSTVGDRFDQMLAEADAALYEAKRSGKDCIVVDGRAAAAVDPVVDQALSSARPPSDGGSKLIELNLETLPAQLPSNGSDDKPDPDDPRPGGSGDTSETSRPRPGPTSTR